MSKCQLWMKMCKYRNIILEEQNSSKFFKMSKSQIDFHVKESKCQWKSFGVSKNKTSNTKMSKLRNERKSKRNGILNFERPENENIKT